MCGCNSILSICFRTTGERIVNEGNCRTLITSNTGNTGAESPRGGGGGGARHVLCQLLFIGGHARYTDVCGDSLPESVLSFHHVDSWTCHQARSQPSMPATVTASPPSELFWFWLHSHWNDSLSSHNRGHVLHPSSRHRLQIAMLHFKFRWQTRVSNHNEDGKESLWPGSRSWVLPLTFLTLAPGNHDCFVFPQSWTVTQNWAL